MRMLYPASPHSFDQRKKVAGIGINDADYITGIKLEGKWVRCPAYSSWKHMLTRVSNINFHNKCPTYVGTSVCTEWLHFSNFRKWWINNYIDGYQLDKDILVTGNKLYSPETCIFVPSWLNSFITAHGKCRGKYKIGVYLRSGTKKFIAQCNNPLTGKRESLGYFDDEESAHIAWKNKKLQHAFSLKKEMDAIDSRLYCGVVSVITNLK